VSVVKSLWASVQGDPVLMRRVNGWLTMFWLVMIPISLYLGWVKSVVYVSALEDRRQPRLMVGPRGGRGRPATSRSASRPERSAAFEVRLRDL
jgi:hypothetical protein